MKECPVNNDFSFMSDEQTPVITEPGNCSFDYPAMAVTSKFSTILHTLFFAGATMWHDDLDTAFFESLAQFIRVIGLVGNQAFRIAFGAATT